MISDPLNHPIPQVLDGSDPLRLEGSGAPRLLHIPADGGDETRLNRSVSRSSKSLSLVQCREMNGVMVTAAWLEEQRRLSAEQHRSRGPGKRLVQAITSQSELSAVKRMLLAAGDAHGLYRRCAGFSELTNPERWMEKQLPDPSVSGTEVA